MAEAIVWKDHNGLEFKSKTAMCRHHNITKACYDGRLKLGWSLEEIFTTPQRKLYRKGETEWKDHLGNVFATQKQLCEHYNINPTCFLGRLKEGWDLEKALTTPSQQQQEWVDFHGNVFNTKEELCAFYNITVQCYNRRKAKGWTIKDILTVPVHYVPSKVKYWVDHNGKLFKSKKDLCKYYHITISCYDWRKARGLSIEEILTGKITKYKGFKVIQQIEDTSYFFCRKKGKDYVLSFDDIDKMVKEGD